MNEINENHLLENISRIHTTVLGLERIRRNLSLDVENVVEWCKSKVTLPHAIITKKGKNWYVTVDGCILTINASNYCIITGHKEKIRNRM